VLTVILNALYITSGILILIMFLSNVKAEAQKVDSYSGATIYSCENCDEID
jgi:hypothetical protein